MIWGDKMNKVSIKRIKEKDERYFEQIYNEYYPLVKYVVFDILKDMEDTKDICQDVFYTVYNKIEQYNGENFKYWLLQIAKNKAYNHLKKEKAQNKYLSYESMKLNQEMDRDKSLDGFVWRLVETELNEEQRKIVILKSVFDFSFNEIAQEMGLNKTYCYRVYKESIKKLNRIMRGVQ